jgi:sugar phosphate isomerase/epimerase
MLSLPFASGVALARYLPAEEGLTQAARLGCTHWYVDLNHEVNAPERWKQGRVERLRREASRRRVRPILHGSLGSALASETAAYRSLGLERARWEIDLAGQLRGPLILHPSSYHRGRVEPVHRDKALTSFLASVVALEDVAARQGVDLWLENLPARHREPCYDSVFSSPSDYERLLAGSARSGMIFDIGHANVPAPLGGVTLPASVNRVAAICFSDNDGREDRHVELGSGSIDFSFVLRQLHAAAWWGIVAFETGAADVAAEVAYLQRCWNRLPEHADTGAGR